MSEQDSSITRGIMLFIMFFLASILLCYPISLLRDVSAFALFLEFVMISFLMASNASLLKRKRYITIYLFMAGVRFILVCYQSTYGNIPMAGSDTGVFHSFATNILYSAEHFFELLSPASSLANRGDFYERMVAVVYYVLGAKTQYIYFISFILAEIAFRYIYKSALIISDSEAIASKTALLFYIWPMEVIFSVSYLREMQIQAFTSISMYFLIKFVQGKGMNNIFVAMVFTFLAAGSHSGMVAVLVAYFIIFALYDHVTLKFKFNIWFVGLVSIVFMIFLSTTAWDVAASRFSKIDTLEDIATIRGAAISNTDYIGAPDSAYGVILQSPIRVILFLLSPLPWHINSLATLVALLLDGILRYWVLYRLIRMSASIDVFGQKDKTLYKALLLIWVLTDLVFSWGTNSYGTAMRHRLKIFPMELLMFYTMYELYKEKIHAPKQSNQCNSTSL